MNQILLTKSALEKVENKYDNLIKKRKEISEEIKKARGFGDLSENAEYHAAREAQSLNETEILKVKSTLSNYKLVEENTDDHETVQLNERIEILYIEDDEKEIVKIVSPIESDPFDGKISYESPIGTALLGKKIGDTVPCETPNGIINLKIVSIPK
ncbi:transcription elongation factor GreA [Helicovermis profundi]|uniref:Transcription elongation factor GreA n=1 Tax=Helicovermis profundi TaxID=3065157 RepID=A0AAU9ER12_9FIRM|nr:transcription elongation factor GreA [Clostridia bacterium S502]